MLVQVNISKFDELNFIKIIPRTRSKYGLLKDSRACDSKAKCYSEMFVLN